MGIVSYRVVEVTCDICNHNFRETDPDEGYLEYELRADGWKIRRTPMDDAWHGKFHHVELICPDCVQKEIDGKI